MKNANVTAVRFLVLSAMDLVIAENAVIHAAISHKCFQMAGV